MDKLIIAGGRDFNNFNLANDSLIKLVEEGWISDTPTIICGCASGADTIGEEIAWMHDLGIEYFPADWDNLDAVPCKVRYNKFGKPYNALAGINRNSDMERVATHLLAFWDKKSTGTKDMIDKMTTAGKKVVVVNY